MMVQGVSDVAIQLDRSAAQALRNLRWLRRVSMEQCSASLNIGLTEFLSKERGRLSFTPAEFAALAMLLDYDVDGLVARLGLADLRGELEASGV